MSASPQPSSGARTVTIDHTAFPHIFEDIVDQEPQEQYSVLRLLNKSSLFRFDRRMANHIGVCATHACRAIPFGSSKVDPAHSDFWPTACRPYCRCPTVIFSVKHSKNGSRAVPFPGQQLRTKVGWGPKVHDAPTKTWIAKRDKILSDTTQVLDIVGFVPDARWMAEKVWSKTRLPMVRFIPLPIDYDLVLSTGTWAEQFTANVGVIFTRPKRYRADRQAHVPDDMIVNTLVIHVDVPKVSPNDATESMYDDSFTIWYPMFLPAQPITREFVYSFDKAWTGVSLSQISDSTPPDPAPGTPTSTNMFRRPAVELGHVLKADLDRSFVFVGTESLPLDVVDIVGVRHLRQYFPRGHGEQSTCGSEDIRLAILITILQSATVVMLNRYQGEDFTTTVAYRTELQTLANRILGMVHFKTRKEYRKEVGRKDWYRMTRGYSWQL